jgi:hypothetical protein
MFKSTSSLCWFASITIVGLSIGDRASAWERPPLKLNTKIEFRVEVKSAPQCPPPTAPWYAYFPADARLLPPMNVTPYPTWPMPFPPAPRPMPMPLPNGNGPKTMIPPMPSGPMTTQQWPGYYVSAASVQPVGYVPAQAPSYWYQGR